MNWKIAPIPDEDYFGIGCIFGGMDEPVDRHKEIVISASTLKAHVETNLFFWLMNGGETISDDLQEIFDVGSAFHCHVLEAKDFKSRYLVSDTVDASEERVRISSNEYKFIDASTKEVAEKYPYLMNGENVEIAITGVIDGVPVKCKIDKLHIVADKDGRFLSVEIVDLKGVWFNPFKQKKSPSKDRWELRKKLSATGYDLQAFFYKKLVEAWLESIGQNFPVKLAFVVSSKKN